jgi:hypothetical protein
MPFKGSTPDEAAGRLGQCPTRAEEPASAGMAKAAVACEKPREAVFPMSKHVWDVTKTERQESVRQLNRTT